jgi:hypothetical protein
MAISDESRAMGSSFGRGRRVEGHQGKGKCGPHILATTEVWNFQVERDDNPSSGVGGWHASSA